jgi:hypothetical protein
MVENDVEQRVEAELRRLLLDIARIGQRGSSLICVKFGDLFSEGVGQESCESLISTLRIARKSKCFVAYRLRYS